MITIIVLNDGATPERPPASPFSGTSVARLESLAAHHRDLIAANAADPPPWYQKQTIAELEAELAWKRERGARAEVVSALRSLLTGVAS